MYNNERMCLPDMLSMQMLMPESFWRMISGIRLVSLKSLKRVRECFLIAFSNSRNRGGTCRQVVGIQTDR